MQASIHGERRERSKGEAARERIRVAHREKGTDVV